MRALRVCALIDARDFCLGTLGSVAPAEVSPWASLGARRGVWVPEQTLPAIRFSVIGISRIIFSSRGTVFQDVQNDRLLPQVPNHRPFLKVRMLLRRPSAVYGHTSIATGTKPVIARHVRTICQSTPRHSLIWPCLIMHTRHQE